MRTFMLRFLWIVLIFSLTACGQGAGGPQDLPEVIDPTTDEPLIPPPDTGGTSSSQDWVCTSGPLPPTAESAKVEMGPSPGIPASPAKGEHLEISAVVFTSDCEPLSGVAVRLWHTDPQGVYGPDHDDGTMQCCYYQATVTTDDNGRFDIVTVRPSTYQGLASGPPAHIHFEILDPELRNWQAEFVFKGDPQLTDPLPQGMIAVLLQEKSSPEGPGWFGEAEVITPLGDQDDQSSGG